MIPQWHRGSDWAVAHARKFRDEVAERVKQGIGVAAPRGWVGGGALPEEPRDGLQALVVAHHEYRGLWRLLLDDRQQPRQQQPRQYRPRLLTQHRREPAFRIGRRFGRYENPSHGELGEFDEFCEFNEFDELGELE